MFVLTGRDVYGSHKKEASSMTSFCCSPWETVITRDHFLFPIGHLFSVFFGQNAFNTLHVWVKKKKCRCWVRLKTKDNTIPAMNAVIKDLLKPEDQKNVFPPIRHVTQWLVSFPSWHGNYSRLRNAGTSGHAELSHFWNINDSSLLRWPVRKNTTKQGVLLCSL